MSFIVNSTSAAPLPVNTAGSGSVIKRSNAPAAGPSKAEFAPLMANAPAEPIVTGEEKQFFAELFPKASDAIRNYGGYSPAGVTKPVQLGTIIDMKG